MVMAPWPKCCVKMESSTESFSSGNEQTARGALGACAGAGSGGTNMHAIFGTPGGWSSQMAASDATWAHGEQGGLKACVGKAGRMQR